MARPRSRTARRSPWRPRWTDAITLLGCVGFASQLARPYAGGTSDQWLVFGSALFALGGQSPRVADAIAAYVERKLNRR